MVLSGAEPCGETLDSRVALPRLGGAGVVPLAKMLEPDTGFVCLGLLDSLLPAPVLWLVLLENSSAFDFGMLCWSARVARLLQLYLVVAVAVAGEYEVSCP